MQVRRTVIWVVTIANVRSRKGGGVWKVTSYVDRSDADKNSSGGYGDWVYVVVNKGKNGGGWALALGDDAGPRVPALVAVRALSCAAPQHGRTNRPHG